MEITTQYLTTKEAAKYCNLSQKTLEHHRGRGTGPRYIRRTRKLIRYTIAALDDWMAGGLCPTKD